MAQHSFSAWIGYDIGLGATKLVGEVMNIDGPGVQTTSSDGSHLRVPQAFKRFLPGLIDGGEVTFTVRLNGRDGDNQAGARNFAPGLGAVPFGAAVDAAAGTSAGAQTLFGLLRTIQLWRILLPDGTLYSFYAFFTNLGPKIPEDDTITQDVTLKVTGPVAIGVQAPATPIY